MKLKTLALMGICAMLALSSCKKDDDDKEEEPAPTTLQGTWKITAFTVNVKGSGVDTTMDAYADMEACEKDDLVKFNDDKTILELAGATKCDPSEPASEPGGTWSLSADSKKLTIIDGTTPQLFDVTALSATTLRLQTKDTDNGMTNTSIITFTRQ